MNLRSLMGNFEGGDSLIACTFFLTGYASKLVWLEIQILTKYCFPTLGGWGSHMAKV